MLRDKVNSDVLMPALGAVLGVLTSIVGGALLLHHATAFWTGVGFVMAAGGFLSSLSCYRVSVINRSHPQTIQMSPAPRSIREWWNTPKLYPSGDRFAPRESFLYGAILLTAAAAVLVAGGLLFMFIVSANSYR